MLRQLERGRRQRPSFGRRLVKIKRVISRRGLAVRSDAAIRVKITRPSRRFLAGGAVSDRLRVAVAP
jgi:hypothetical protein